MEKDYQTDEEIYAKNTIKFKLFNYKIFVVVIGLAIICLDELLELIEKRK